MSVILENNRLPYDTLQPEKALTDFLAFLRNVESRYRGNVQAMEDREAEMQDLEHYMEMHSDLDEEGGYWAYEQLRDARRERRKLKSENELLAPLIEWMRGNEQAISKLSGALGRVRKAAELIDNRRYTSRTDILEGTQ